MDRKRLAKIREEIKKARQGIANVRASHLASIAKSLGREEVKTGKHPTYSRLGSSWFPLSIPNHSGGTLKIGTARSIIAQLEADADNWEEELDAHEGEGD